MGNLGDDKMDVRLGGIYALQRIMQDSIRDQPTIANVLATYVRTHAAKPPATGQDVPADVQAALAVLAARDTRHDGGFIPDLRGVWVPKTEISGLKVAHLPGGELQGAHMSGVDLHEADLQSADLRSANLSAAQLSHANLSSTNLTHTDLSGAGMPHVDLSRAKLSAADLSDAFMPYVNLSKATLGGFEGPTDLSNANLAYANLSGLNLLARP
ncbi:pentapeptide repeat-containing protein [Streptomyces sp. NPDC003328]